MIYIGGIKSHFLYNLVVGGRPSLDDVRCKSERRADESEHGGIVPYLLAKQTQCFTHKRH